MSSNKRKRIGDLLTEIGLVTPEQINHAITNKEKDQKIGDFLIAEKIITEQQLISSLVMQLNTKFIDLKQATISQEALQLVPSELAKRNQLIPISITDNKLFIAMTDPMDYFAIEEIRMVTGCQIETGIATKDDVQKAIIKLYDIKESMDAAILDLKLEIIPQVQEADITDEDHPIVRLVNQMINNAVAERASDIHFDPDEDGIVVRYRVDGVLRDEKVLPKYMQGMVTARVKIMGGLNITENRIPQDGRIKVTVDYKNIDVRLSTLPTIHGEKIVMRILDSNSAATSIDNLELSEKNEDEFRNMIVKPNGIILITGPTGSGKSTTLYAALSHLNKEGVNIITVEDPVEYELSRVNQVQVKEEVGLTFAAGLRSILRQDPDVLMIGEMRDLETAQIATRAALTGHLVLSTLHTNSAVESIFRLKDMGVEPFLVASSILGILAQRLVRRVCRDCIETVEATEVEKEMLATLGTSVTHIQKGVGCRACNNTGYKGRIAIHELIPIDRTMEEFILKGDSTSTILKYVNKLGFKTLAEDGLEKVLKGQTTVEEVLRVATI